LEWLDNFWADLYSNDERRIRSTDHSHPASLRIRTFRNILDRFRNRFEAKSADYQAEAGKRLIAGNDARNGVVANLLRNDSAGSADSASAALGSVA
jgi:hypothetical protein